MEEAEASKDATGPLTSDPEFPLGDGSQQANASVAAIPNMESLSANDVRQVMEADRLSNDSPMFSDGSGGDSPREPEALAGSSGSDDALQKLVHLARLAETTVLDQRDVDTPPPVVAADEGHDEDTATAAFAVDDSVEKVPGPMEDENSSSEKGRLFFSEIARIVAHRGCLRGNCSHVRCQGSLFLFVQPEFSVCVECQSIHTQCGSGHLEFEHTKFVPQRVAGDSVVLSRETVVCRPFCTALKSLKSSPVCTSLNLVFSIAV